MPQGHGLSLRHFGFVFKESSRKPYRIRTLLIPPFGVQIFARLRNQQAASSKTCPAAKAGPSPALCPALQPSQAPCTATGVLAPSLLPLLAGGRILWSFPASSQPEQAGAEQKRRSQTFGGFLRRGKAAGLKSTVHFIPADV